MMHHIFSCLLLIFGGAVCAQASWPDPAPDPDLAQAWPAWLVGDHVTARRHFLAAANRGHPLGQYNLAMMLLHCEGGACRLAEAKALLRKAADAGVDLAGDALEQLRLPGTSQSCQKLARPH